MSTIGATRLVPPVSTHIQMRQLQWNAKESLKKCWTSTGCSGWTCHEGYDADWGYLGELSHHKRVSERNLDHGWRSLPSTFAGNSHHRTTPVMSVSMGQFLVQLGLYFCRAVSLQNVLYQSSKTFTKVGANQVILVAPRILQRHILNRLVRKSSADFTKFTELSVTDR